MGSSITWVPFGFGSGCTCIYGDTAAALLNCFLHVTESAARQHHADRSRLYKHIDRHALELDQCGLPDESTGSKAASWLILCLHARQ
eukprot:1155397-Pelagomonas_calceolata.AAC.3